MIPELGHFSLWLALGVALTLALMPTWGAARGRADWMAIASPAAALQFALVAFAFGCLIAAFVGNDFSVSYVAANSNTSLPTPYRVAAVWGGHEGSILLWLLMLTGWAFAVARFSPHLPAPVLARILSVMGLLSVGCLLFLR
jgi:cytochrome c-type biogenesis protein CcmF